MSNSNHFILPRFVPAAVMLLLGIVVARAWLSDDAFITFRTIDNFCNGYGLRWNIVERVQTYTHPLWMLVLSGFHLITGEFMLTTLTVSILCTAGALFISIKRLSCSPAQSIVVLALLCCSQAFIDYSTSGLENPLTHLLAAFFFLVYFKPQHDLRWLFLLSLVASFAVLNRMDTVLLFAPPLVCAYCATERTAYGLLAVLCGFFPFILWEAFSLYYYGFPFPNTYYAKLGAQVPQGLLLRHGFYYYADSFLRDPVTLSAVFFGMLAAAVRRDMRLLSVAAGVLLYLLYVLKIGGDFMSGRFFTAPFFCAVVIFGRIDVLLTRRTLAAVLVCVLSLAFIPRMCGLHFLIPDKNWGVTDERQWYYENYGLFGLIKRMQTSMPSNDEKNAQRLRENKIAYLVTLKAGALCFFSGPKIHFIDVWALTDPLLSRLPLEGVFRPGHVKRIIPDGYPDTLISGENLLYDRNLAGFYSALGVVTRGELASRQRVREIWRMNTGYYDALLRAYIKNPQARMRHIKFADLQQVVPEGTPWHAKGNTIFQRWGLRIDLGQVMKAGALKASYTNIHTIIYLLNKKEVARQTLGYKILPELTLGTISVPRAARTSGFDTLVFFPVPYVLFSGEMCSLGHLRIE